MVELFNVNPFAEAMFYYLGKANNERAKSKLEKAIKAHPEYKKQLKKITAPAFALEKLLDSKLNTDNKLIDKYFRKFESSCNLPAFGTCLAFVMIWSFVMLHFEYSPDEMCKFLCESNTEERLLAFVMGLMNKCDTLCDNEKTDSEKIAHRVEDLEFSYEEKWKMLNAVLTYQSHIEELISLLAPAAKLIETAENKYKTVVEEFREYYSGTDIHTYLELNPQLNLKAYPSGITKITPLIFGFERILMLIKDSNNALKENGASEASTSIGNIFIGIGTHLTEKPVKNDVSSLIDKLKTLSDNTRLDMLFYLCKHKAYGQELSDKFSIQRSTVSYHMAKLMDAGFLNAEIIGSKTYYTADKTGIQKLIDVFAEKIK